MAAKSKHQHRNIYTYGAGFDFYDSLSDEQAALAQGEWHPGSADLAATAKAEGPAFGVTTLSELVTLLLHQADGSVRNLYVLGHSSAHELALSGRLIEGGRNIEFTNTIDEPAIEGMPKREKELVSQKFAADARIVLVGCDSAEQPDSLQEHLSREWSHPGRELPICVAGFSSTVWWCVQFSSAGRVVSRGRVATEPPRNPKSCKEYKRLRDLKVVGC